METFHKLAGVQDASDLTTSSNERPSQPQVIPEPPPVPESEPQADTASANHASRGSRASLPLNRQPSHKSFRSSKYHKSDEHVDAPEDYPPAPQLDTQYASAPGTREGRQSHDSAGVGSAVTGSDDFAWGPQHPCFPHPNPHCAPDSEEYRITRVIRVRRDWLAAGDLYPQYANLYPEILDPLVSDAEFRYLVSNLNSRLKAAFDPFATRAWVDAVMGTITGWIWDDLGLTGAKRAQKGMESFLDQWNREREREGKEVRVVQLRTTGFMSLDFVVPDPGIDAVQREEQANGMGIGPAD